MEAFFASKMIVFFPWVIASLLLCIIMGLTILVTRILSRKAIVQQLENYMDEETRNAIKKMKLQVELLEDENENLRERVRVMSKIIRGVQATVGGAATQPDSK